MSRVPIPPGGCNISTVVALEQGWAISVFHRDRRPRPRPRPRLGHRPRPAHSEISVEVQKPQKTKGFSKELLLRNNNCNIFHTVRTENGLLKSKILGQKIFFLKTPGVFSQLFKETVMRLEKILKT